MARYAHPHVLDNGPAYIKAHATRIVLLAAYTFADSYATVTGGDNILAEAAVDADDFTLANGEDGSRKLTSASGLNDTAANATVAASATKHFAFLDDEEDHVLWVTPEESGQAITAGNPTLFPALEYHAFQPEAMPED